MNPLYALLGTWKGNGEGHFPTIEPFEFSEELRFERRGEEPLIHYEQKTVRKMIHLRTGNLDSSSSMLRVKSKFLMLKTAAGQKF